LGAGKLPLGAPLLLVVRLDGLGGRRVGVLPRSPREAWVAFEPIPVEVLFGRGDRRRKCPKERYRGDLGCEACPVQGGLVLGVEAYLFLLTQVVEGFGRRRQPHQLAGTRA
jgi:hypothetical protein